MFLVSTALFKLDMLYLKKLLVSFAGLLLLVVVSCGAGTVVTPWAPLFKGVDHAIGTNFPDTVFSPAFTAQ